MRKAPPKKWFAEMDASTRIDRAKVVVKELTVRIQTVLELHAATEIIVYSNKISSQIPPSNAAAAYNRLQDTIFQMTIIKLLSLWEDSDSNRMSIPTVVELVDDPAVINILAQDAYDWYAGLQAYDMTPPKNPETQRLVNQMLADEQLARAKENKEKAILGLTSSIGMAKNVVSDEVSVALRNARDHMSHALEKTKKEIKGPVPQAKYGFERILLDHAIDLVQNLYLWVNGKGFDIAGEQRDTAKEQAAEFWNNVQFRLR